MPRALFPSEGADHAKGMRKRGRFHLMELKSLYCQTYPTARFPCDLNHCWTKLRVWGPSIDGANPFQTDCLEGTGHFVATLTVTAIRSLLHLEAVSVTDWTSQPCSHRETGDAVLNGEGERADQWHQLPENLETCIEK